jgi:hypothetical protein
MSDKRIKCIYKYRPLYNGDINNFTLNEHTLSLLTRGELYFSSPREFNDPFDCWVPVFPSKITEEFVKNKMKEDSKFKEYIITEFNRDISSFVKYHNNPMIDYDLKTRIHRKSLDDNLVCCFSTEHNNLLMWSHYAESHKGICLGIKCRYKNKVKYLDLISEKGKVEIPIESVNYSLDGKKEMPIPANMIKNDIIKKNSYLKAKEWEYEKEIRAIITKEEVGSKILKLRKNSIKEIYFGINVPYKIILKTMKILYDSKYNNFKAIKFYKIKDDIGYFKLDFIEIKKDYFYKNLNI